MHRGHFEKSSNCIADNFNKITKEPAALKMFMFKTPVNSHSEPVC